MKLRDWTIAFLLLAAFVLIRGEALLSAFVLPFETAFQEAIALHHLENGIIANRLLPVVAELSGEKFYHTAHPPLLHVLYALLYKVFGVHETVTRIFSLLLFFGSLLFWRSLAGEGARRGEAIIMLAFALPVSFLLCTTTNYEPLSIFTISLLAWLVLQRQVGVRLLLPVLAVGLLVDWPVYLAVPALLIVKWKETPMRRRLLFLFACEVVFFFLLQAYQYAIAGEAAVFSHAETRANPLGLFSAQLWSELGGHVTGVLGGPATLIVAVSFLWAIALVVRQKYSKNGPDKSDKKGWPSKPVQEAFAFFLVFSVLLLFCAFQLVCRHYVYLLYFVPLCVFSIYIALASRGLQVTALVAVLLVFAGRDAIIAEERDPKYYGMATAELLPPVETAFSTSAVGAWKFYAGIETAHPLSEAMDSYILDHRPQLVHLDLESAEVSRYREIVEGQSGEYIELFTVPGERVYLRKDIYEKGPLLADCDYLKAEKGVGTNYREPVSVFVMPDKEGLCNDTARRGRPAYSLRQHPGPQGSLVSFALSDRYEYLSLQPAIIHSFPFAKSDGADFMALVSYNKEKVDDAERMRLAYFRHLHCGEKRGGPVTASLPKAPVRLYLMTAPGPRLSGAFDDAYWLGPVISVSGDCGPKSKN